MKAFGRSARCVSSFFWVILLKNNRQNTCQYRTPGASYNGLFLSHMVASCRAMVGNTKAEVLLTGSTLIQDNLTKIYYLNKFLHHSCRIDKYHIHMYFIVIHILKD